MTLTKISFVVPRTLELDEAGAHATYRLFKCLNDRVNKIY